MRLFEYITSRGAHNVSYEEVPGTLKEYLRNFNQEELAWYLNWIDGDESDIKYDESKLTESVVAVMGEDNIIVMGDGPDFYHVVGIAACMEAEIDEKLGKHLLQTLMK